MHPDIDFIQVKNDLLAIPHAKQFKLEWTVPHHEYANSV